MTRHRAIFLDRDGTLNRDAGFVHRVEELELLPGVVEGLRRLAAIGFRLVIATNQSGIARGYFGEADMHAFHRALCQRLAEQGISILDVYHCPYHPTDGVGEYRRDSPLRKPNPGMIVQAAAEHQLDLRSSFVIGDKSSDVLAGQAAGCRTILLRQSGVRTSADTEASLRPDFVAVDMIAAAEFIERTTRATIILPRILPRLHAYSDVHGNMR